MSISSGRVAPAVAGTLNESHTCWIVEDEPTGVEQGSEELSRVVRSPSSLPSTRADPFVVLVRGSESLPFPTSLSDPTLSPTSFRWRIVVFGVARPVWSRSSRPVPGSWHTSTPGFGPEDRTGPTGVPSCNGRVPCPGIPDLRSTRPPRIQRGRIRRGPRGPRRISIIRRARGRLLRGDVRNGVVAGVPVFPRGIHEPVVQTSTLNIPDQPGRGRGGKRRKR